MTAPPSFEAATLALLHEAVARLGTAPAVRALHLPPARPDDPLAGESCALELADGTLGLSYVLFGDTLPALRARAASLTGADALTLAAAGLTAPADAADRGLARTLGFAAANALSAWVLRRCRYEPPAASGSLATLAPARGEKVGMIGYFAPLLPALAARGARVVVVELRPELHGEADGVQVTGDARDLAACTQVLSTATVLLNGSFAAMRAHCTSARRFVLVGPSAGLLPDALFARGVDALGGSWIEDGPAFVAALTSGQRRGASARKFEIAREHYPGLPRLLTRA